MFVVVLEGGGGVVMGKPHNTSPQSFTDPFEIHLDRCCFPNETNLERRLCCDVHLS